jgi:phosphoribosylformylglycinamidine cyclo-ligase
MLNYKDSGVDVEKGDLFVEKIKSFIRPTYNKKVISGVGGFCALYEISPDKWLATGTDGVGTKVKLAQRLNSHKSIGQDLVAMCVNDIICSGASPSFFLDYLATGKLDLEVHSDLVEGIASACQISECALIGGETAEMPGVYSEGVYDLAGFAVGELNPTQHISGDKIKAGDKLIGLLSSGFHSNGYSLVRKLINDSEDDYLEQALTPTRLYWPIIKKILANQFENVVGMAHITGGGFHNIPRMNENLTYVITNVLSHELRPEIMNLVVERSGMSFHDQYETFNMGIGFVLCVKDEERLTNFLNSIDEQHLLLGHVDNLKDSNLVWAIH